MSTQELAKLVAKMRTAQIRYFGGRTGRNARELLEVAKDYERRVDAAVEKILVYSTPSLFEQANAATEATA